MIATMHETETEATTATETATLELVDIYFADNDLTRPLYRKLINYPVGELDPHFQVDLGVQVGRSLGRLEITFELRADLGVQFASDPADSQRVKVRDLAFPDGAPVGVEALLQSSRRCVFTWTRIPMEMARVRAFRIYCQKANPTTPENVYGGLFLALIDQPRLGIPGSQTGSDEPVESLAKLRLIGSDDNGRPLYNIFKDYSDLISAGADLEIEPTYRIYERQELRFDVKLEVPGSELWTFNHQLIFLEPPSARSLFAIAFPEVDSCHFSWTRKDTGLESPSTGSVSTFHLGVNPGGDLLERLRSRIEEALLIKIPKDDPDVLKLIFSRFESLIDPTVIEPPRCTNGICVG